MTGAARKASPVTTAKLMATMAGRVSERRGAAQVRSRRRGAALAVAAWLAAAPLWALADIPPGPPPPIKAGAGAPKADSEGFVPESRPADMTNAAAKENVPAAPLVATAYGFIWLAVLVYVGTVAARTTRLTGEVTALRRRIDQLDAAGAGR